MDVVDLIAGRGNRLLATALRGGTPNVLTIPEFAPVVTPRRAAPTPQTRLQPRQLEVPLARGRSIQRSLGARGTTNYGGRQISAGLVPYAEHLSRNFGLRLSSGYRTPERNRAVRGVRNSYHLRSGDSGALDFVGPIEEMRRARAWAREEGAREALIHNAGSGTHLHVAFAKGGFLNTNMNRKTKRKLASGGPLPIPIDPSALRSLVDVNASDRGRMNPAMRARLRAMIEADRANAAATERAFFQEGIINGAPNVALNPLGRASLGRMYNPPVAARVATPRATSRRSGSSRRASTVAAIPAATRPIASAVAPVVAATRPSARFPLVGGSRRTTSNTASALRQMIASPSSTMVIPAMAPVLAGTSAIPIALPARRRQPEFRRPTGRIGARKRHPSGLSVHVSKAFGGFLIDDPLGYKRGPYRTVKPPFVPPAVPIGQYYLNRQRTALEDLGVNTYRPRRRYGAGGDLGAIGGQLAGQALIPIPGLGAFAGGLVGGKVGALIDGLFARDPRRPSAITGRASMGNLYADGGLIEEMGVQPGQPLIGPTHEGGGIDAGNGNEVEGGETMEEIDGKPYVFSDRLKVPGTRLTFAQMHAKLTAGGADGEAMSRLARTQERVSGRSRKGKSDKKYPTGGFFGGITDFFADKKNREAMEGVMPYLGDVLNIGRGLFERNTTPPATRVSRSALAALPNQIDTRAEEAMINRRQRSASLIPGLGIGERSAMSAQGLEALMQLGSTRRAGNADLMSQRANMIAGYEQADAASNDAYRQDQMAASAARSNVLGAGLTGLSTTFQERDALRRSEEMMPFQIGLATAGMNAADRAAFLEWLRTQAPERYQHLFRSRMNQGAGKTTP